MSTGIMEGPGVKVISERLKFLEGRRIDECGGNTRKINVERLVGRRIISVSHHGKNLLIDVEGAGYLKIHFLMYGTYSLNTKVRDDRAVRLMIGAGGDRVYFYNCSVSILDRLDFKFPDILSDEFSVEEAVANLRNSDEYVCEVLLDQELFPGVGNIIKVEGLYRAAIHPLSICKNIPEERLRILVENVRRFSETFYEARKNGEPLRNYTACYGKRTCARCGGRIVRRRIGRRARISYLCEGCQILY